LEDPAVSSSKFPLSEIDLFKGLSVSDLHAIAGRCQWGHYAREQRIIGHQDDTNDVYFIVRGQVRATIYSASGKEVSFRDLGAGMSIGELSAIDGAPRSANVIALTESVLASMPAESFREILRDHPEVSARVMTYLVNLVRKLSDRIVEFGVLAVRNRIHSELLRLALDVAGNRNIATLSPAPKHADIASRVATHREAVTRELNALAGDGLIDRQPGAILITDIARLKILVEEGAET
jgi:CRP-like cAMP-binding protein